jgi:hypothetical protein
MNIQEWLGAAGDASNSAQSAAHFHALEELLDQEESMLKSKHVPQTSTPSELDIIILS